MSLIDNLIRDGYLRSPHIIEAFRKVKRRDFLPGGGEDEAEMDSALPIGYGQTISQPLTVAFMFELLAPQKGQKILDIGSGSGWTVALLAEIAGESGRVYGVEIVEELKKFAENNIARYDYFDRGIAKMIRADGSGGLPEFAPFDRIIVAAAAREIPGALPRQLKVGGRLVLPVGPAHGAQEIVLVERTGEDDYREKRFPGFVFVPLVDKTRNPQTL